MPDQVIPEGMAVVPVFCVWIIPVPVLLKPEPLLSVYVDIFKIAPEAIFNVLFNVTLPAAVTVPVAIFKAPLKFVLAIFSLVLLAIFILPFTVTEEYVPEWLSPNESFTVKLVGKVTFILFVLIFDTVPLPLAVLLKTIAGEKLNTWVMPEEIPVGAPDNGNSGV